MTTPQNDPNGPAAHRRQRADYATSLKTLESTAELRLTARRTLRKREQAHGIGDRQRSDRQHPTHQQTRAKRSNPHRHRVHNATTHRLRGFLPWASSVASR